MNRHGVFSIVTILFGVSSFSFFASLSFIEVERSGLRRAVESVCSRIESEYVRADDKKVKSFIQSCFRDIPNIVDAAQNVTENEKFGKDPRRRLITLLNERMSILGVSHMIAFAPDETVAIWTNETVGTGARARLVDGEIVITRIVTDSPAARAGIEVGDLVVAVDGKSLDDAIDVERTSGIWEILRPDETHVLTSIELEPVQDQVIPYWDQTQEITGIRVLKIPSFLPQAVDNEVWPKIRDEIVALHQRNERLIVDLRGNPGGSFPAMLRVLGALKCDRSVIGWIYRGEIPKIQFETIDTMRDEFEAEPQLEQLKQNNAIALAPFPIGPCFDGPIGVLIDQNTASVAEIFAQSLKERPRTLIAGWRSSGQVVMARWFQIAGLSQDYTVSIPVGLYRSSKGEELEGRGVSPDQILTDRLMRWRSPKDPWIRDVARAVSL